MTARAGWFPDPAGRPDHYRWWDGSAWTRLLTTDPAAATPGPDPGPDPEAAAATPDNDPDAIPAGRHQATDPTPWHRSGAVVIAESPAVPARPPGYERPAGAGPRTSWRPALLAVGAVVLAAAIVLAIVLFGKPTTPGLQPPPPAKDNPSESASPSPSPSPTGPFTYDAATRVFAYDGLRITMPGKPYTVTQARGTDLSGKIGVGVQAFALVHKNYNGQSSDWDATVEVDEVGADLTGKNLDDTADKIISMWSKGAFAGSPAKITNEQKSTITKNEPRPARIITADMHYSIKGLASRYDHVSLLLTKGPSGKYVAFLSSRPNDASAKVKKALQASINTVHLT